MEVNYIIDSSPFNQLKKMIKIPTFQRSVVWSKPKKILFIDTLLSGFPFGSLLIFKDNLLGCLLVDGLQRYSTLLEFEKNPLIYMDILKICDKELTELFAYLKNLTLMTINSNNFKHELIDNIKNNISFNDNANDITITRNIVNGISFLKINDNKIKDYIEENIFSIIKTIKKTADISNLMIPYIVYTGDFDNLPEIFEKINTNGTKLTNYEIYSAKWCNYVFDVDDIDILKTVDKKYEKMNSNSGIEINNYKKGDVIRNKKINLFEYCFALSKILTENCTFIFQGITPLKPSDVDSIGFLILSGVLENSTKKMDSLVNLFNNVTPQDLSELKNKILNCSKETENLLSYYVKSINDNEFFYKYNESQIVCIIITLFKIKYLKKSDNTIRFIQNNDTKKYLSEFKNNMPKRYIHDIIIEYWSNNGNTKLNEEISKRLYDNRFLNPISKNIWKISLDTYLTEQLQKPMLKMRLDQKIIFNYIVKNLYVKDNNYKQFKFINVISKKIFNKQFGNQNASCALGNICLIPTELIKNYDFVTLYERIDIEHSINVNDTILSNLLYPSRFELKFTQSTETFTYNKYLNFLKDRHNFITNQFVKLICDN